MSGQNILISLISRNVMSHAFFNVRECSGTSSFPNLQGKISFSSLLQLLCACYQGELKEQKLSIQFPHRYSESQKGSLKKTNTEHLDKSYRLSDTSCVRLCIDCLYI